MHASSLTTESQYIPEEKGAFHQDIAIHPSTLLSGELLRRLDRVAYPQLGQVLTGTVDGASYPPPAVPLPMPASALPAPPPVVVAPPYFAPFSDDFNRADGAPGNGWVDASAPSAQNCPTIIASGRAQPQTAGKGNTLLRDIKQSLGYEISASFVGGDTYHVLMFSSKLDQSHYIYAAVTNGTSYVSVDGVNHDIGGAGLDIGTMRVTVSATGLISVYWKGNLVGTYQLTTPQLANLGTYAGFSTFNQLIDSFSSASL